MPRCDDHVRLFTKTTAISTPSHSTNLCSKQSCLKFLSYFGCFDIVMAQAFKDLGAVFRNCKHMKTIQFQRCGDAVCELLDHIPNIAHKTLRELRLKSLSLTAAAAAVLGRSLCKMSSLKELELIGKKNIHTYTYFIA